MGAAAFALAVTASAFAQAPPAPPHSFFGDASTGSGALIDGEAAPDGSVVTAHNEDGDSVGDAADNVVTNGVWLIRVAPEDASTVIFSLDGVAASDAVDVVSGSVSEISLSAGAAAADDADADADADAAADAGDIGLPATGSGGLAGESGLPVLPLVLALSVGLALTGVAVTRRSIRA